MTMNELIQAFETAKRNGDLYIGVAIRMPNLPQVEIIINPVENFSAKLAYYQNAYNENCHLKNRNEIQIVNVCSDDFVDFVMCELSD